MGSRSWMDRVQPQVRILAELIDQGSTGLLQRHGDRTPAETMVQSGGPLRKLLRSLLQFPAFAGLGAGHQQLPTMLLIGPIDTHKSRKIRLGRLSIHELRHESSPPSHSRLLGSAETPIVESGTRHHLSIRLGTKASRCSNDLLKASSVGGQGFVAAGRLLTSSCSAPIYQCEPEHSLAVAEPLNGPPE